MAEHTVDTKKKFEPKDVVIGALAEFDDTGTLLEAAGRVRAAGYKRWEVYSPFPVHGIDDAMGPRPTILPYVSALCALLGLTTAVLLQWWTNGVDYTFWLSGKTFFALPSSMPIMFELTVLFTAIGTFVCVVLVCDLPLLSNPLFKHGGFRQGVTTDKFYIAIDANDPLYVRGKTAEFLRTLGPARAEDFQVRSEPTELPRGFVMAGIVLLILAMIPPILIVRKRNSFTSDMKIHLVPDMDFQPKLKAQKLNGVFVDDREARPQVDGTIARGDLEEDERFYEGLITPAGQAAFGEQDQTRNVSLAPEDQNKPANADAPADGSTEGAAPTKDPNLPPGKEWVTRLPEAVVRPYLPAGVELAGASLEVRQESWSRLIKRGQQQFNIYCATCHGLAGDGDGLVTRQAMEVLRQTDTWAQAKSMYDRTILPQPVGQIFGTITHGKGRMPGYAAQIATQDRWAIVAYVKTLQRSREYQEGDLTEQQINDALTQAR